MLDGGDALFRDAAPPRGAGAQSLRDRARLIARSAVHAGLDAANVGRRDLAAGLPFLAELGDRPGVPWVSANLRRRDGSFPFPRWRYRVIAGVRVLITGVAPPDARRDTPLGLTPLPPEQAVGEALRQGLAEAPADLVIVLSTLGMPAERQLARAVPGIQVIIGGGDRQSLAEPVVEGDTAIVHAADRGRFLGLLELDPEALGRWHAPYTRTRRRDLEERRAVLAQALSRDPAPARRRTLESQQRQLEAQLRRHTAPGTVIAHRLLPLSAAVGDDPQVAGWVAQWKREDARTRPAPPGPAPAPPRRPPTPPRGPGGAYTGTGACRSCHPAAYRAWSSTSHARSYASLRGQPRAPECLQCHAARLPRAGGGTTLEPIVGCEACHGPGAGHRGPGEIRRTPAEETCRTCHRGHHPQETFSFGEDYGKVRCDREGR